MRYAPTRGALDRATVDLAFHGDSYPGRRVRRPGVEPVPECLLAWNGISKNVSMHTVTSRTPQKNTKQLERKFNKAN
jgi:hypothetical protein